ncbi:BlaR1 family beta-lactam sensor/signal transducer [Virgibacillus pantothenticus]|uniref:BlaR1 family beta-lactam sensor/signal transducer n=1 Tax=Virgibacillus pantothenticus TaxID=1473 RepID=UPI001B1AD651|nr:BlaR1 family beta-lactam sensor/signal transducer [Virgibacillus pantothenticus]MBU8568378.1 BlaR1 family beta-lactam sensor/signal transducer [Virgibacillus pantothenticus]MBU8602350.1 BlaR1 family beta-lactam sensor/signal transducer [Virgibacillus pantothenticus]MBU8636485.1 BlaR1 family beta-lactam sensor/signal transducer [Virgibacillus pantothenticus]MBU8642026.1 BlaR1 family beta-lactam sensor/signal transducer [Virgibacillus pantothenticus]MBU8645809.1 BlaR1 family beta-lactam senso
MFFTLFITGLLVSSFTITIIFLIKKIFQNQLSAKWHYNLWFLLLFALTLPFMPTNLIAKSNFMPLHTFQGNQPHESNRPNGGAEQALVKSDHTWMQAFATNVNRPDLDHFNIVIASIWLIGILVLFMLYIHSWLKLRSIKHSAMAVEDKDVLDLFSECKRRLHISKKIRLLQAPQAASPMTFGLFTTYVVLPSGFQQWLSKEEIKYILLHELTHYKHKDTFTNYLLIFYQIIYWFNPLIWIAFRAMRLDREMACDTAVLNRLDKHDHASYGKTLLHFIHSSSTFKPISLANQLNGSKSQIKRRIMKIAVYQPERRRKRLVSISVFMLMFMVVFSQIPFVSAMTSKQDRYEFHHNQISYEDLSEYFHNYEGSFVLYDSNADSYTIYNQDRSTLRVSPNSTYKIFSALLGLEANVISPDHSTMKWNGTLYPYQTWNQDQNLSSAMASSVTWYFREIDQMVQEDKIEAYLKRINYGNRDISGGLAGYWLESSLRISPVEQVQLLHDFYTNQFQFKERNIQAVKEAIQLEKANGSVLSGKTGTGSVNEKNTNGWFIGYVEAKGNTYFFATNIQRDDHASGREATDITLSILKDKHIYIPEENF